MSTTPAEEVQFYLKNLTRFWLGPKLDLPQIPGPPGWRVVGNAPALAARKDVHRVVLDWVERYGGGNGIVKFWLFGQPIVVVSDPAVAAEVLARPGGGWFRGGGAAASSSSSSPPPPAAAASAKSSSASTSASLPTALPRKSIGYSFFDLCSSPLDGLRSFFSTTDERHWAAVRKACAPAFSVANVKRRYFPVVLKHADALAEQVRVSIAGASSSFSSSSSSSSSAAAAASASSASTPPAFPSSSSRSRPVELQEHIELAMLDVALEALFGCDLRRINSEEVAHAFSIILEEAQERVKFPLRGLLLPLLRPGHARKVRAAQRTLAALYARIHDWVRDRGVPPPGETALWACLARLRDPSDPEGRRPLPKAPFCAEVGALMMASFDTSSHTAGWVLLAVASRPDVQRRVVSELGSAGLLHTCGGDGLAPRQLTPDDLEPSRLPYLCAVVAESMRLWPVAAAGGVRETTAAKTRVGPYVLPPGVIVWPMIYALHVGSRNWGPSAHAFRPERWLDASTGAFVGAAVALAGGGGGGGGDGGGGGAGGDGAGGDAAAALPPAGAGGGGAGRRSAGPPPPKRFLPFSDGGKACLGQQLGLTEVKAVVAVLCGRFWFELPPQARGAAAAAGAGGNNGAHEQIALTLKVRGGLRLVCRPHGAGAGTEGAKGRRG